MYYLEPILTCGNVKCSGTPIIPIKLVVRGQYALALSLCPRCHKKYKVMFPLYERDRWLLLIKHYIFYCEKCGTPNPMNWRILGSGTVLSKVQKVPAIKILLNCIHCNSKTEKIIDQSIWSLLERWMFSFYPTYDQLIEQLSDKDSEVRQGATLMLGEIGDKTAIDPLIRMLQDPNPGVRAAATWSLGKLGENRATTSLIKALNDQDNWVRIYAAIALGKLDPKYLGKTADEILAMRIFG